MFSRISKVFCCVLIAQICSSCSSVQNNVETAGNTASHEESYITAKTLPKKTIIKTIIAKNTLAADIGYNNSEENSTLGFIKNVYSNW